MMRKLLIAFLFTVISIGNANSQDKNTFWLGADISGTTYICSQPKSIFILSISIIDADDSKKKGY